ncbi:MAG TPA: hypothetical protein VHX62_00345 [Solirubrobacteraceae bacterium]|jgi:hypothetical protein|nr:hypothetical protein [Solirubrobacteraceae bacterium]
MPTIANPRHGQVEAPARHQTSSSDATGTIRSWAYGVMHRRDLTRALAQGTDPESSRALARRAAQLTTTRNRRTLARSLRRVVADAHDPQVGRARSIIVRRGPVLDAESLFNALSSRLAAPGAIRAQGVAQAERILTNADISPLYNHSEPGALRGVLAAALTAMDGEPTRFHEFPIPR